MSKFEAWIISMSVAVLSINAVGCSGNKTSIKSSPEPASQMLGQTRPLIPRVIIIGDNGTVRELSGGSVDCQQPVAKAADIFITCTTNVSPPRTRSQLIRNIRGVDTPVCDPSSGCNFHSTLGFNTTPQPGHRVEVGIFYFNQTLVFDFPSSDYTIAGLIVNPKTNMSLADVFYSKNNVDDTQGNFHPPDGATETVAGFLP